MQFAVYKSGAHEGRIIGFICNDLSGCNICDSRTVTSAIVYNRDTIDDRRLICDAEREIDKVTSHLDLSCIITLFI